MDADTETLECPLCLEVLEADDINFLPCSCGYQPYSENPAQFKPLTEEEIQQVKRERKLKESQKKQKLTESRKHLANLRVVQKNLVFVNGLPSRLSETELLRRQDYFGKYGKIIKIVTSPAHNGQSNSICAYITYSRSDEALRTIQAVCNYHVDGRTLKATLGTTKYCSRYLKGTNCQKTYHLGKFNLFSLCCYINSKPESPPRRKTSQPLAGAIQPSSQLLTTTRIMNGSTSQPDHDQPESSTSSLCDETLDSTGITSINEQQMNDYETDSFLTTTSTANSDNTNLIPPSLSSSSSSSSSSQSSYSCESATVINSTQQIPCSSTSTTTTQLNLPCTISHPVTTTQATITTNNANWSDESSSFFSINNTSSPSPSQQSHQTASNSNKPSTTNKMSMFQNVLSLSNNQLAAQSTASSNKSNFLLTNGGLPSSSTSTSAVKNLNFDEIPEYKPFGSNMPPIHLLLFGRESTTKQENGINDADEQLKRFIDDSRDNGLHPVGQENDEGDLGFDPCSLFMTALASDIEDERRPSSKNMNSLSRFMNNNSNIPLPSLTTNSLNHQHLYLQQLQHQQQLQAQQQHQQLQLPPQQYHNQQHPSVHLVPNPSQSRAFNNNYHHEQQLNPVMSTADTNTQLQLQGLKQTSNNSNNIRLNTSYISPNSNSNNNNSMNISNSINNSQQIDLMNRAQKRYTAYNGTSPTQTWNTNQYNGIQTAAPSTMQIPSSHSNMAFPLQQQQHHSLSIPISSLQSTPQSLITTSRMDFTNQIPQQQRLLQQQSPSSSPSQQQISNHLLNNPIGYSNLTQNNIPFSQNISNDRWLMNAPLTDPAIVSLGKIDNSSQQWSIPSQPQQQQPVPQISSPSSSTSSNVITNNNNLISPSIQRWPQQHVMTTTTTNGYSNYVTSSDGRS
ncbi:unnamed protein product [Didymodactylos carnosus]|uniref:RRM domain-containing protein n=1 Tax=Didymodactylos carnosus TaxID=1234261 RepID=A0A813SMI5_9BILA|nr:unnamed protein product [Didymodactylos carnosus]CAF0797218.1 unnamed protein product [Didymodactylos carnosus]CAF3558370.1 unnamed protein product [Didymodactylos carnosus]CAF3581967.1 unnamed protein product [Didymodactylos carnosus]